MSATAVVFITAATSNAATLGSNKAEFACQQALNIGSKSALRSFLRIYRNSNTACNALASTASAGDTPTVSLGDKFKASKPRGQASNTGGDGGGGDGGHGDGGHGDGGHGDGGHGDGGHGDGGHGDGGHGDGGHGDGGHGDGGHGNDDHGDYRNLTMN